MRTLWGDCLVVRRAFQALTYQQERNVNINLEGYHYNHRCIFDIKDIYHLFINDVNFVFLKVSAMIP